jgi:uncharacterized protein YjbJ (UPF0337 family)
MCAAAPTAIGIVLRLVLRQGEIGWRLLHLDPEQEAFDMNWDIVEGNWKQFKGKVKVQWGKLTDDQLDKISGRRDELAGRIQEAYGVSKDEAEAQIKRFEDLDRN